MARTDFDMEKTQAPPSNDQIRREMREKELRYSEAGTQASPSRPISSDTDVLNELFSYHPPTIESLPRFSAINQAAKNFAEVVLSNCPPSADRSDAIRKIREARMTANAAVALNGLTL